jgi:hypothetical protein
MSDRAETADACFAQARAANQSGKLRILARQTLVKPRNGVKGVTACAENFFFQRLDAG